MNDKILPIITARDLTQSTLDNLISSRDSFVITGVPDFTILISKIERAIEDQALRCRVYTENRAAAMAAVAIPTGITQIAGAASAIGIGLHNLVTFNPDYEIARNLTSNKVTVTFKK